MDPPRPRENAGKTAAPYTWVNDAASFAGMLKTLQQAPRLAVDTEADSLYHYYEKVCLIQFSTDEMTFVVDPLVLRDLSALSPVMSDNRVEKVFHAAGYDLLSLRRDFGFTFFCIFDTHIAAQLLGYPQLGLSALLAGCLGVAHSKHRQRDDWSRRPLSREQLHYAAMDTHHLLALRDLLASQLREKGRLDWALEEFEISASADIQEKEFDPEGFLRIKGSRSLALRELAILRELYLLRDRLAREMNLPPFKVMNNSVLVDLSRKPPTSPRALSGRPGISLRIARNHAVALCEAVERARSRDSSLLAPVQGASWKPASQEARLRLERLKLWRERRAREHGLQVGVLFPGELLEVVALSAPSDPEALGVVPGMRRWRVREFGAEILAILQSLPENKHGL